MPPIQFKNINRGQHPVQLHIGQKAQRTSARFAVRSKKAGDLRGRGGRKKDIVRHRTTLYVSSLWKQKQSDDNSDNTPNKK